MSRQTLCFIVVKSSFPRGNLVASLGFKFFGEGFGEAGGAWGSLGSLWGGLGEALEALGRLWEGLGMQKI